jgi:hypothetical protein
MRKRDPLEGASAPLSRQEEIRRRQRSRALVTGLALAAFVVLIYAITIVRMGTA